MIDLHSHTTASDGEYSPTELLELASRAGVTHLAVTDHDTVAGLSEASTAARDRGLTLINGIELSAFVNGREVHILGHFIQPTDTEIGTFASLLRNERRTRMEQMVAKMQSLGVPVTMAEVDALAQDSQLGRPHLARVLVNRGVCQTVKEAFDRFLAEGKPACVDRYRLSHEKAIDLIRRARGVATIAHPGVSKVERHELMAMRDAGLGGIEAHHSDHPPSLTEKFLRFSRELDLIPTCGSDFHGETVAPNRKLGSASMDPRTFDALNQRAGR